VVESTISTNRKIVRGSRYDGYALRSIVWQMITNVSEVHKGWVYEQLQKYIRLNMMDM
jgi:hypothetical protein